MPVPTATRRTRAAAMPTERKLSLAAGLLFIATFLTSIPALALFQPVLDDPVGYVTGAGADTSIAAGASLELLLIVANIGSALVLYPVLKRQSGVLALGFVTARVMESALIAVGILAVLTVVTMGQETSGGATGDIAVMLAALKDWTFILGPGFVVGIGNGLVLGYLMYRSGLVPRRLAVLGLVGGPAICATGVLVVFGAIEAGGTVQSLATVPEFIWELGLGIYLTVKGFRTAPILGRDAREARIVSGQAATAAG